MAKRPPIGWLLLAGAVSAAGAALTVYTVRKRRGKQDGAQQVKSAEKDTEPGIPAKPCPKCGADVKAYEFYCAACGRPMEEDSR